jgi:two-component system, NtrC family, sensor histidine kinase PilS
MVAGPASSRPLPILSARQIQNEDLTGMQSIFDERLWLAWLTKARVIILTFLLGVELAIARFTTSPLPVRFFVNTMLLWYAVAILHILIISFWDDRKAQASLQVLTDFIMVTLVVYATGGVESSLNFLYPLIIIVACILLPRTWAYLMAALAFLLYGTVLELSYFSLIPSYSTTHPSWEGLQAIIFINLFAYLAVAYLASLLSAKLRQVNVKLKSTSGELESLQALHHLIIQSISGGLITTGLDGYVTLSNGAAQLLLESTEQQLWGRPISQLFIDPVPKVEEDSAHGEVRFACASGFRKTFRVMVSSLVTPEHGTIGYVYTLDDLTEIRRLERDLRLQDRLAAVGRLAAAIAHEIRNPLTSIAGSVSMLSEIPELTTEHRQLLEIVTRESDRLNAIITDFLAYSRGKQYHFTKTDIIPLIEDTLTLLEHRMLAEKRAIRIERRFSVQHAWALADGDKLKQVFWNFCENAIRAMRDKGHLTVSLEMSDEDWEINFADTGPGIRPQVVERIFEPFQSEFEGGTGLGLAIVYQIVQAHEGKVWARSKLGEGSVFVLRLRRMDAEVLAPIAKNSAASSRSDLMMLGGHSRG